MPRGAIVLLALLLATPSRAQVSGSAAIVSDYRFRGISLSDNRPAVQAALAYDHKDGFYAGVLASSARPDPESGNDVQVLPYLGYARRFGNGIGWDVGVSYAAFLDASGYDYPEIHVGLSSAHLSARLNFSHRYFGDDSDALYLELNGSHPLSDRVRLLGHAGWLHHDTTEQSFPGLQRQRFDLRAGLGVTVAACDLQIAWVWSDGEEVRYAFSPEVDHSTLVLSLSRSW
ncbi:TorF family putative porin [Lysobacter sp. LF1]|uniref:TorF family putative porin n=1 Tax=Lysobacter stagni TaxID=3045172 RepID=A0ABT6XE48_9GAMM|nr:TorF family putative porin [Lysobacter sp. LF1]MDI9238403.1 TorF family putative porin [Lysobacter sp. LF1]